MAFQFTDRENYAIDAAFTVCARRRASSLALQVVGVIGWGENHWNPDTCNSGGYCGVFQLGAGWQRMHDYRDVAFWTEYALDHGFYGQGGIFQLVQTEPDRSPGWIANQCQGAYADLQQGADYYNQYRVLADELIRERLSGYTPPSRPIVTGGGYNAIPQASAYDWAPELRQGAASVADNGAEAAAAGDSIRALVNVTDHVTTGGPSA